MGAAKSESATDVPTPDEEREAVAADARQAAIEETMGRLAKLGMLDAATQASLVKTLQRTSPEDWPAVVEEFRAVLAESAPPAEVKSEPIAPSPPVADRTSSTDAAAEDAPAAIPVSAAEPSASLEESPSLTIRNACFATRVTGWGLLDRCDPAGFRPGQEVIVYFELENLTGSESTAGHTTCIDTALNLVTVAGQRLHTWRFDPITETCPSRRRDYFARYVLRIPEEAAAGDCRVDVAVTDTLAGTTATTSLPLAITAE